MGRTGHTGGFISNVCNACLKVCSTQPDIVSSPRSRSPRDLGTRKKASSTRTKCVKESARTWMSALQPSWSAALREWSGFGAVGLVCFEGEFGGFHLLPILRLQFADGAIDLLRLGKRLGLQ